MRLNLKADIGYHMKANALKNSASAEKKASDVIHIFTISMTNSVHICYCTQNSLDLITNFLLN